MSLRVSPELMPMDPLEPFAMVGQSLALPVLTMSPYVAFPLSLPRTNSAETLLGAAKNVRQKASTRARKGRNSMGGSRKAR